MTSEETRGLARLMAGSALTLAGRRALITLMTAVGTALIARFLGTSEFGQLASAVAIFTLALAASDFGFSLVLGRDMSTDPAGRARLLATALQVQLLWAAVLAGGMVILGLVTGLDETRGVLLVILAPAVLVSGFGAARSVFLVLYRVRELAVIDLTVNLFQVGLMLAIAAAGGGAIGVACSITAGTIANSLLVVVAARRLIGPAPVAASDRRLLLRTAVPLGVASFLSSVYFTIDLALLGWLVVGPSLGDYAAATKVLSLLVVLPGVVMAATLPGVSSSVHDPEQLNLLAARVWHWLTATGLPLCVGVIIFARPLVELVFGADYAGAVPLVRILAIAAAVALLGNVLGMLLVAQSIVRPMIIQNTVAAVFNVGGNVLLVPRYGVTASAWLTVATEVFVTASALVILRRRLPSANWLTSCFRPALAVAGFAATAAALAAWPLIGIPVSALVLLVLLVVLRAWPSELSPSRWRQVGV